jgi:ubiquinone/menaquinone biosynthesis C-methylase UbiE
MKLPYVKLLALLGESNLPPGGLSTVRDLIVQSHLSDDRRVLHAGCNAGFLSREISRRVGCQIVGIDIEADMTSAASQRARAECLSGQLRYSAMDMRALAFADASFDAVISGGALAFVDGRARAISEWIRVTKRFGFLADAEFYYGSSPSAALRSELTEIIGVPVPEYDRAYWLDLFSHPRLDRYYLHDADARAREDRDVVAYCERLADYRGAQWPMQTRAALVRRILPIFRVFNENMRHLRYLRLVYRRSADRDEPMLYA